ncbi:hypothetical protein [Micromonospora cathayae]|uniref:Cytochrome C biogenesis protein transmembrane region n=1 Tax=Micromonospora cathayae TaxID=3028804 RepID=A0ABY7ZRT4_9ACTN|nr:hypothetical protein [Micromonospora sp. HUAS 3]WDZ85573.1 hypothetical protein PVK37_03710 [Micromonospora sp. HUAS 3]
MSTLPRVEAVTVAPSTERPPRVGRIIAFSALAGILLAVIWSYHFVDSVIGDNVANALLGHDAKETALAGTGAGLIFAFVSGLAGTFTACNIAMAASIGPMSQAGSREAGHGSLRSLLRPVGWLTLGMVAVSGAYGFVGVLLGERLPQLSTDRVGDLPVRLIQSSVVFGVIGLALIWLGLAALGVVRDVFANRPVARVVTLGALIGGFLIGRPYPLFNKLFHWAVDEGNPLYGAGAFILQSLGNVLVVTVIFALLVVGTRGGFLRWLTSSPARTAVVTGSLLVALGVFTVVYWDVRLPAMFGYGWFPSMPWN